MPSTDRRGPAPPAPGTVDVEGRDRIDLTSGWRAAPCAPGACGNPAETDSLDWLPAAVPGTAAGALRDAGRWDYGDDRDFDAEDWWFRTEFEAGPEAEGEIVLLRLDGVATFHEVFLNGELVGRGESMFAVAQIDLGELLRDGPNELAIRCLALNEKLGEKRKPRARWRTKVADNRLRFVRTMLLGRCPGFAPGPAAVGPWRPVWIERRRALEVAGLQVRTRVEGTEGVIAVSAEVCGLGGFETTAADVVVTGAGEAEASLTVAATGEGAAEIRGEVRVPEAALWWPHTHGDPALHHLQIRFAGPEGEVGVDAGRVGFRELAPGPGDDHDVLSDGLDLHLNGVRVFARGAVWTPVDFVGMAPGRDRLREALEQVRDAGMNMLRIPGTGAYESPDFHDLCDELGILVWQDFAFANFDYPFAEEEYSALAEAEVGEQLSALSGRPSLAVLCGNSEVEQQVAMLGLDPEMGRGGFFGEKLPQMVAARHLDAIYVPSAPCGGARPFVPDKGIANYYGVGGYMRPLTDARLAEVKFAAECLALANVPDEAAVESILPGAPLDVVVHHPRWKGGVPRDAGSGWDFDDVRDHYLQELFGVDPGELRRYDHERYLELSRAVSGEAMASVFGEWRRPASPCGGGLVLWLRDLTPGAGWGLVDHLGNPKPALRALRGLLAPVAVWLTDEHLGGVAVHVANDGSEQLAGTLRVALYSEDGHRVGEVTAPIELDRRSAESRDVEAMLGGFVDASWSYRFGPPAQTLIVASVEASGSDEVLSRGFYLPVGPPTGRQDAAALGLRAEGHRLADGRVSLQLSAERFVYGASLRPGTSSGAVIESFHLEPDRKTMLEIDQDFAEGDKFMLSAVNMSAEFPIQLVDGG